MPEEDSPDPAVEGWGQASKSAAVAGWPRRADGGGRQTACRGSPPRGPAGFLAHADQMACDAYRIADVTADVQVLNAPYCTPVQAL